MNKLPTEQTVKFNVGGRHFEVSRSLIEQQPESVLGRMISSTWHSNPNKVIFIDRDGNTFAQVLNYLRDGNVVLPESIPTDMFKRDMDYYCLVYDEKGIQDGNNVIADLKDKLLEREGELLKKEGVIAGLEGQLKQSAEAGKMSETEVRQRLLELVSQLAENQARQAEAEARLADNEAQLAETKAQVAENKAQQTNNEARLQKIEAWLAKHGYPVRAAQSSN